ncbi:hypothetical protein HDV06_005771 [Boothiomyces sp. JEL0866]|nr:hypothetical protein HDV06_005771 [Boothiomyces sp. JEL0866]
MKFIAAIALLVAAALADDQPQNQTNLNYTDSDFNSNTLKTFQMPTADQEVLDTNTTVYFGTQGRGLRVKVLPKKVVIFSFNPKNNATTALRFNVRNEPRLGVEWHHNRDLLNDTKATDVALATRLLGLFEVNSQNQTGFWNTIGTSYLFKFWDWSDITLTWVNSTDSNATLYLNSIGSPNGKTTPQVNLTVKVSADSYNLTNGFTIRPTGLKYDFDIIGPMSYKLSPPTASTWKLVKRVFTSHANVTISNNTIADGNNIGKLQWTNNVTIDGQQSTMSFDGVLKVPALLALGSGDNNDRDAHIDFVCAKRLVVHTIPYFVQSFNWDPTVYVEEATAVSDYGTSSPSANSALKRAGGSITSIAIRFDSRQSRQHLTHYLIVNNGISNNEKSKMNFFQSVCFLLAVSVTASNPPQNNDGGRNSTTPNGPTGGQGSGQGGTDKPKNVSDSSFTQDAYHSFQMPRADAEVLNPLEPPHFGKRGNGRGLRINATPRKVIVYSFNPTNNATTALRFNVNKEPRLGIEWNHNHDLLNDKSPADVSFATRLVGLYEVNANHSYFWNTTGTKYPFRTWTWGDISVKWVNDTNSNATLYLNSVGTPSGQYSTPHVNLTVVISADTYNLTNGITIMPTGLKYNLDIIGAVSYSLSPPTSSSWKLVKRIFSSFQNATFTNAGLSDGGNMGSLVWTNNVTIDSQPSTVSFDGGINVVPSLAIAPADNTERDDHLDFECAKSLAVYSIPYFTQSFNWDPSIFVDESNAISAYTQGTSSSSNQGSSGSSASNGAVNSIGSIMTTFSIVLLAATLEQWDIENNEEILYKHNNASRANSMISGSVLLLLASASAQYFDHTFNWHSYSNYNLAPADIDNLNINTATKYTGIQGNSVYVKNNGKKVLVYSKDTQNNTNVLKFSIRSGPKFTIETRNPNSNDHSSPAVLLSARLIGLYEENAINPATDPLNTPGTIYKFQDFEWTDISLSTRVDSTSATLILNSYGHPHGRNDLKVNLTAYISPDSYKMGNFPIGPTSIKYDFDVIGKPVYKLAPTSFSTWNFVKKVASSQPNANVLPNAVQYENESSEVGWDSSIMIDGNPTTVTFVGITAAPGELHNDGIEQVSAKSLITYSIPHFESNVSWDPSLIKRTLSGASQLIL